ncbi:MAG TPA: fumarylacetoacetate hydrolase family protein [Bacteroidales bacterium]|nr:fumarylacetoacetate hydrolase family protein [Bacteroidales bacterium]HPS16917.1 fumarylacetoacetate hydrolase family protein [Bacteroidales bacterium]
MKIICIEGNYKNNEFNSSHPVFFIKPETCLLKNNHPFFIPDHSPVIIPNVNLVIKISRLGKNIQEKFAHLYYNEIGIGVDITATDTLADCKKNSQPWDTAKSFDNSAPLGNFIPITSISNLFNIPFSLQINSETVLTSNSSEMIFNFNKIIQHVSQYITIKTGDLVYTGSPLSSSYLKINDRLECYIGSQKLLWFNIK